MQSADDKIFAPALHEVALKWIPCLLSRIERITLKYGNHMSERNSYDMESCSLGLDIFAGRN